MKNILLVEDSKEVFQMVDLALKSIAQVRWEPSLEKGRKAVTQQAYDLFLLDIELPDGTGVDLCSEISSQSPESPIFFLTSHKDLSEKVLSFAAGADDYITKPFEPLELKARVEARLRKLEQSKESKVHLRWKEIEINSLTQEVKVLDQETWQPIELTALEFKLLTYFALRANHVIPRDQILDDLWGKDVHVYPRSVDTHVSKLRKKLGPVSNLIGSIHGAGYKFTPSPINAAVQ